MFDQAIDISRDTSMSALNFSIGPFSLALSHAILFGALLIAAGVGRFVGRRQHTNIDDVLLQMVLVAVLTARIAFVALWFEQYRADPWTMLDIRDGGFHGWTGLAAAALYLAVDLWRNAPLRKSLALGVLAGAAAWGGATGMLAMTERAPMPTVALTTLTGAPTTLAALAGKPVVVNLWASWCPPCLREMPVLAAAQQQETQINFVFVNQGEDAATAARYLDAIPFTLTNVWLDPVSALGRAIGSSALPTTLFYDESGRLVDTHLGALSTASLASKLAPLRPNKPTSGVASK
jgi:thiol-disulfide isomerase/thioredoxin